MRGTMRKNQGSGAVSVSYALLHVIIVITLLIGFDVWFVCTVWG